MNNLLLIIGMIALSNGNISFGNLDLFDNKKKPKLSNTDSKRTRGKKIKQKNTNKSKTKISNKSEDDLFKFDIDDVNRGMKMMDLSDEDLERGMEIITRTKKYMSSEERKILIKIESLLDLVKGIKKLNGIEFDDYEETNFFRSMDDEDKKNMMIREILEVFPEKRKGSLDRAIDMKKKIDLFTELFLPDDFGEGGFSLSSLVNINPLQQTAENGLSGGVAVVAVIGDHRLFDVQMVQQLHRHTGVLGGDEIHLSHGLRHAPGNVPQIADGCGDEV